MKVKVCTTHCDKPVNGGAPMTLAVREASPSLSKKAVTI
jgi:hypothetical protein